MEVVPEGKGLTLQRVALVADKARIDVTGRITDLSGPVGNVTIKARRVNMDNGGLISATKSFLARRDDRE